MSVKDEQLQEIEALASIYPDEITVLSEDPYPKFKLIIKPTTNDEDELRPFLLLEVKFHANYPEQSPEINIIDSANVDDTSSFESEINKICEENLGMPVIFTLASHLSEQLSIQSENRQIRHLENLERKQREEEEAEQKRFEGTCVTVESFIKWKVKFDAERNELTKTIKIDDNEIKKLTGRQLFEKDRSLYDSDIKFVSGEGGEVVEVDESLFEDMLDLDLDDAATTGIDLSDVDQ
ncbi:unnamed protein product [Rotaria sordida]|uniref:RWD domain-containing protein n=1 Tax=Rotaria sordida TaxID=392033 RepID=A0A815DXH6_9BILA|nr:unnamed protein product [Rotaria sordida]CAF1240263.1 unnamed protein product [Rotaria sordida]CAF1261758.1 unnamed protein product [Rotaria sordida]CAF1303914.1 unnamed protein product [Rotaria sordida]CAF1465346.1 unnamed protein product [Rotaria sordida]